MSLRWLCCLLDVTVFAFCYRIPSKLHFSKVNLLILFSCIPQLPSLALACPDLPQR